MSLNLYRFNLSFEVIRSNGYVYRLNLPYSLSNFYSKDFYKNIRQFMKLIKIDDDNNNRIVVLEDNPIPNKQVLKSTKLSKKAKSAILFNKLVLEIVDKLTTDEYDNLRVHCESIGIQNVDKYIDHLFIDYFKYNDNKFSDKEMVKTVFEHIKSLKLKEK